MQSLIRRPEVTRRTGIIERRPRTLEDRDIAEPI
jgi:hypothetical protein